MQAAPYPLSCALDMVQSLKLHKISHPHIQSLLHSHLYSSRQAFIENPNRIWTVLRQQLGCNGRHSCLFSDGRKQEQARKALESALGEKKSEFEKWNKEIQKREERGNGGNSGRGGWFGGRRWFGWFGDDHFWGEAQQAIIAIIGILSLYLLLAKGGVMFAIISNSLLFVLRGTRNSFAYVSSKLTKVTPVSGSGGEPEPISDTTVHQPKMSAKERVVRKWGMD